jgi:hypothetical protein
LWAKRRANGIPMAAAAAARLARIAADLDIDLPQGVPM